jgi:hypothetical protein
VISRVMMLRGDLNLFGWETGPKIVTVTYFIYCNWKERDTICERESSFLEVTQCLLTSLFSSF